MKIILDVCGTLYHSNTTFDFIDYLLGKENKHVIKRKILKTYLAKYFLIILGRIINIDIYRSLYIKLLKGFTISKLNKETHYFVKNILFHQKISQTHSLLDKLNKADIIICSASLDIIIKEVSCTLEIEEHHATNLIFSREYCTGKIKNDLLGQKDKLFENVYWVITDNKSDLALIKKASKYTIVSRKKDLPFWQKHNLNVEIII
ncbi:hypothetical protein AM629_07285 [Photorhabdus heterorhabditis]|uniref:Haloacid dehalogenase-like hydrolase n=1 Tax=Photorhabdus heterorhabditis TaxID=880156 RepID=A0ABR5KDE0_9GAMM|nr:haloacid dehalogenase-like hydrolase [Photorhabdus heterorhabditis]KOY62596.1 hypothetical protein AM629_07285 [Photorhabdus heterorhabditis]